MASVAPGRILIVDDDEAGRYVWAHLLRDSGHTVFEASRLGDGEVLLHECMPDLIVLDVHLPDGDGIELTRRLKSDEALQAIMVLQMSASFVQDTDQVRGLEAGADTYLTEPTSPGVFLATVRALLRLSRAERALKEALKKEQEARAEAEAANRLKDDFLATLSHELRTPLQAIVSWVSVLSQPDVDRGTINQAIAVISRNARAQTSLVEDLLDVSRITTGQLELQVASVDLSEVIRHAIENVRFTAAAKDLHLTENVPDMSLHVRGDQMRLHQVFWNLLTNAVKFTPRGGRVAVDARLHGEMVSVAVTDNGQGIEPEFLSRVFDRFRRGDPAVRSGQPGLGLGLAIARDVVMLHGGELSVASEGRGRGSVFTVTLPVSTVDASHERGVASARQQPD